MVIYETRIDVKVTNHQLLAGFMVSNGYSVRELAKRVGVSDSTIGHLRSGKRKYVKEEVAKKIAKALRLDDNTYRLIFEAKASTVYREVPGYKKERRVA